MCGCFSACSSMEQQECQMPKALFLQDLSLEAVHHPMGLPVTPAQFEMPTGLKWNEGVTAAARPDPPRLANDRRTARSNLVRWRPHDFTVGATSAYLPTSRAPGRTRPGPGAASRRSRSVRGGVGSARGEMGSVPREGGFHDLAERGVCIDLVMAVALQGDELLGVPGARVQLLRLLRRDEAVVIRRHKENRPGRDSVDDPFRMELQRLVHIFERNRIDRGRQVPPSERGQFGRLAVGQYDL